MCLNVLRSVGQICDKLIKKTMKERRKRNKQEKKQLFTPEKTKL